MTRDPSRRTGEFARMAAELHRRHGGKITVTPRVNVDTPEDLAVWYTPGVAEVSRIIHENRDASFEYTWRWNTVAVASNGTRVLGLGDIGPEAALPVMEGKALIFKALGGVDAIPLVLDARDPDTFVETVIATAPSFGAINLEDIRSPDCYEILDTLTNRLDIPVWHDDRQGTATVVAAGVLNALKVVGKNPEEVRVVFLGAGAAGLESARFLELIGVRPQNMILVDIGGVLHPERTDLSPHAMDMARRTNGLGIRGGLDEAVRETDVLIALSRPGPGVISPNHVRSMNRDAVVFACANPVPEIWPHEARDAGAAIVATGRSDFPNQVNNSLVFPGFFRGVLDVRARKITDAMCLAAVDALASSTGTPTAEHILPSMNDRKVPAAIAVNVGMAAMNDGVARRPMSLRELQERVSSMLP